MDRSEPRLIFITKPVNKIRFRYKTEKGSHGVLTGIVDSNSKGQKKNFPTVQLENYDVSKIVNIRASLYTEDEKHLHVLELMSKNNCENGMCYEQLGHDATAKFQVSIVNKKKEDVYAILRERTTGPSVNAPERMKLESKYRKEIENQVKGMNLNAAKLCFEAFYEGNLEPFCRMFSETIYNSKSTQTGDLRICRLSIVSGRCSGGDEVFLFCDKVKKDDIVIRFFEKDHQDQVTWESRGKFKIADWHHQVALVFQTPEYKTNTEKKVYLQLFRTTDGAQSEPVEFTYIPDDSEISRKRKKPCPVDEILYISEVTNTNQNPGLDSVVDVLSSSDNCLPADGSSSEGSVNSNDMPLIGTGFWESFQNEDSYNMPWTEFYRSYQNENLCDFGELMPNALETDGGEILKKDLHSKKKDDINRLCTLPSGSQIEKVHEEIREQVDLPQTDAIDKKFSSLRITATSSSFEDMMEHLQNLEQRRFAILKRVIKEALVQGVVHPLLKYACKVLFPQPYRGNTILHQAVLLQGHNIDFISRLLHFTSGCILNVQNKKKETPLHLTVIQNNATLLKLFLQHGGNPCIKNKMGNTCYHFASCMGNIEVMNELLAVLESSKILSVKNYEGSTPLHLAVIRKSEDCVKLLVNAGAELNVKESKCGKTALHLAIEVQPSIANYLLSQPSIGINIADFSGETPLSYAHKSNLPNIIRKLEMLGAHLDTNEAQKFDECEESQNSSEEEETFDSDIIQYLNCDKVKKLCTLMDAQNLWEKLAPYLQFNSNVCKRISVLESPTKQILSYIQKKYPDRPLETLIQMLQMTDLPQAVSIVKT